MKYDDGLSQDKFLLQQLTQTVLNNLENEQFGVEDLSERVGISRSHLHRKLKLLKGKSVSQFIREVRLEEAMKLLRDDVATISEIAYRVGFSSPSYFYKSFQKYYGYPPGETKHIFHDKQINQQAEGKNTPVPEQVETGRGDGLSKLHPDKQIKPEVKPFLIHTQSAFLYKVIAASVLFLFIGFMVFYFLFLKKENIPSPVEKSIAVLPFNNLSTEEENQYFADGIVEDLLNRLSMIKEFKVISRTSSDTYRERGTKNVPEIAAELGVSYIVEGSVQKHGNNARITVQLIDAKKDYHIWAQSFDRDVADIFNIQSEIAVQIASELNTLLTSAQITKVENNKTTNLKAYENYQLGRFYWNKRTEEGFLKSIEYFEKAIEADPNYGLAYAGLADTYNLMTLYRLISKAEGRNRTITLALKALELDENLAEGYTALGSIYDYVDWDWPNAEKAFEHAIEINPNFSTAHHYYSEDLSIQGRHIEAREHINKAIELDPLSFIIRIVSTKLYYNQGLFQEALAETQKSLELYENHPMGLYALFENYWQLGKHEKAFEALIQCFNASDPLASPVLNTTYYDAETAKKIYEVSGLEGVIQWMIDLAAQSPENSYFVAHLCGMLGEDEQAVAWLEKAYDLRLTHIAEMGFNIHFKNLHANPRFIAILKKTNMYPYYSADTSFH